MMHNSPHQFPAIGLRLYQPCLQFIAEGHELVHFGNDAIFNRAGIVKFQFIPIDISQSRHTTYLPNRQILWRNNPQLFDDLALCIVYIF